MDLNFQIKKAQNGYIIEWLEKDKEGVFREQYRVFALDKINDAMEWLREKLMKEDKKPSYYEKQFFCKKDFLQKDTY